MIIFGLQQPNSSTCNVNTDLLIQHNSRAEYERLEPGMSRVEVESILGRGIEIQRSHNTATFEWKNLDCSSITVAFENGKLINKQQSNLQ